MKANPRNDWQIPDVQKLCDEVGLRLQSPSRGSHYKASSDAVGGMLTIPARRPIKAVYIKTLVGLAEAHLAAKSKAKEAKR